MKLQENKLSEVKEWNSQLVTHAYTNGVYVLEWDSYVKNDTMADRWSRQNVGDVACWSIHLMAKM